MATESKSLLCALYTFGVILTNRDNERIKLEVFDPFSKMNVIAIHIKIIVNNSVIIQGSLITKKVFS